ncbi:MAG: tail fiber protein [Rhizomicrobium sp.]|nr:tail fiber protein [Rhizomicrobium sp.]
MSEPYVGEIRSFGFNYAPYQWAMCNGQLIAVSQNAALFAILGTTYGGNGTTTFQLPNLQGRVPMHWGSPPGIPATVVGEVQGEEQVTVLYSQMPQHNHGIQGADPTAAAQETAVPSNATFISRSQPADLPWQNPPALNVTAAPNAIGNQGGNTPHENRQPYQVVNFCIALYGVFPVRN